MVMARPPVAQRAHRQHAFGHVVGVLANALVVLLKQFVQRVKQCSRDIPVGLLNLKLQRLQFGQAVLQRGDALLQVVGARRRSRRSGGGPATHDHRLLSVSAVRSGPGNGLGLAIAQRVAQLHGAALELSAAQPSGLRVTVRFPQVAQAE